MSAFSLINRYARTLVLQAQAKGYAVDTVCRAADVAPSLVRDDSALIDPQAFCRISRNVKLLMGDEFCGFTASPCRIGTFEMMCEGTVSGGSLGDALRGAFEFYAGSTDDLRFDLQRHDELTSIGMQVARPDLDTHNFLCEWWFVLWSHMAGWLIGEEIPVIAADFPHPRGGPLEEYAEVLSGQCRFSQPHAALLIPTRYLDRPVVRSRSDLNSFMSPQLIDFVHNGGIHRSFRSTLKARLRQQLERYHSLPSIEEAAAECHVSSQTLRRRLQAECSSYRMIKEEVRREAALKWLGSGDLTVGEVSLRTGFAEPNGLSRALKTWAGVSPSDVRHGAEAQWAAGRGQPG